VNPRPPRPQPEESQGVNPFAVLKWNDAENVVREWHEEDSKGNNIEVKKYKGR
jgi:hypothetical protein